MCGLAGLLGQPRGQADPVASVARMAESLRHRGPDDEGTWADPEAGVALGHRRLAVIELSLAGHQPMHSACGRYVIAFNGEIYNHQELRVALEAEGRAPNWRGHSDTETLVAAFAAWGVRRTIESCVGMFALALWDRAERRLHLARDRFGEKPLYYGWSRGVFLFGSELKALRRYPGFDNAIDRDALALFLQLCYVPAPHSIFRSIYKLEPGCILSLSPAEAAEPPGEAPAAPLRKGGLGIERYWSVAEAARRGLADPFADEQGAVEALESALCQAVRLQSVADVPLGAFLSGGVDSSTIVALMQKQATRPVRTFTVGFAEAGFDEAGYAKAIAAHLGTDHTEILVTPRQALEVVGRLPELYCEPFADSSQIPTHLISEVARRHVTVALSGDAGDELFAGYERYRWSNRLWRRVAWLPAGLRRLLGAGLEAVPIGAWNGLGRLTPWGRRVTLPGDKAHKLGRALSTVQSVDDLYWHLVAEWHGIDLVPGARPLADGDGAAALAAAGPEQRMMLRDALGYLPDDILHKVDRAAMGVSLETRMPFLDHRVAELAWRLPLSMKLRNGQGKWALRQVLYRHVPCHLIERPKAGFAIPVGRWLQGPLRDWAEELLSPARLTEEDFFQHQPISLKWQQHLAGSHDHTRALWPVLMFQAWRQAGRDPQCSHTG